MKVINNKIIEITESELFDYWLKRYDEIYTFEEFKYSMIQYNVKIVKDEK